MSKGTPITTLRIPPDLMAEIEAAIISANERRADEPYTKTTWMLACFRREVAHLKRGRGRRAKADKRRAEDGN